jgi:hypothetical protein
LRVHFPLHVAMALSGQKKKRGRPKGVTDKRRARGEKVRILRDVQRQMPVWTDESIAAGFGVNLDRLAGRERVDRATKYLDRWEEPVRLGAPARRRAEQGEVAKRRRAWNEALAVANRLTAKAEAHPSPHNEARALEAKAVFLDRAADLFLDHKGRELWLTRAGELRAEAEAAGRQLPDDVREFRLAPEELAKYVPGRRPAA